MARKRTEPRERKPRGVWLNRRDLLAGGSAGIAGILAGCSGIQSFGSSESSTDQNVTTIDSTTADGTTEPTDSTTQSTGAASTTETPGTLTASADSGAVGDAIRLEGSDLPESTEVDLVWHSVDGRWGLVKQTDIVKPQFPARTDHVATVSTNDDGTFAHDWSIPEDYGGDHTVAVRTSDGNSLAKTTVGIDPSFEIDRKRAPLGEAFNVTVHGLGISGYTSEYEVAWDNGLLGIITAISSHGRAEVTVPATGPVGKHVLRVGRGWTGSFYLNLQQSPYEPPDFPTWTVEVTDPPDDLGSSIKTPGGSPPDSKTMQRIINGQYPDTTVEKSSASLSVSPQNGSVGDEITVTGTEFTSNQRVDLVWLTKRGNRVKDGFHTTRTKLDTKKADGNGRFETTVTAPDDLGGVHPLVAETDGSPVAVTTYSLSPTIAGISPDSGPVGTEFTIHLKGVGWTEYDNTYAVAYDNHILGYACGFNSKGDVKIPLTASGPPGKHTIDLFPSVYQAIGDGEKPDFYTKPQLSYRTDHPGRALPAFRFVFETTES